MLGVALALGRLGPRGVGVAEAQDTRGLRVLEVDLQLRLGAAGVQLHRQPEHDLGEQQGGVIARQQELDSLVSTVEAQAQREAELEQAGAATPKPPRSVVLVRCGKGRKDRFVPIGARALGWIDKYLAEVRPLFVQDAATLTFEIRLESLNASLTRLDMELSPFLELLPLSEGLNYSKLMDGRNHSVKKLSE